MFDGERDYKVGPGKPPLHTRFQKGRSGNPRGRSAKNLPVLLNDKAFMVLQSRVKLIRRLTDES